MCAIVFRIFLSRPALCKLLGADGIEIGFSAPQVWRWVVCQVSRAEHRATVSSRLRLAALTGMGYGAGINSHTEIRG